MSSYLGRPTGSNVQWVWDGSAWVISAYISAAQVTASVATVTGTFRDASSAFITTGSVSIDASNRAASTIGTDVFFFVSGSTGLSSGATRKVAVFGGDTIFSGGLSGSLQRTSGGLSYLVAGLNTTISTSSLGQVTITATSQGDLGASYIVIGNTSSLSNERALVGSTGVKLTDAGANSSATLTIDDNIVATVSGTIFTGNVKFNSGVSGSLQQTTGGLSYLVAGQNVTITTSSLGQVTISAPTVFLSSTIDLSREQFIVPVMSASFTSSFFVKEGALPRNLQYISYPAIVVGNSIYLYGGLTTSGSVSTRSVFTASVNDPLTWTEHTNILPAASYLVKTFIVKNKIILLGAGASNNAIYSASLSDPMTVVDTGRIITASVNNLGQPFGIIVKDYLYLYGGHNASSITTGSIVRTSLSDVGATWEYMGEMPGERRVFDGYICDDYLYIIGGANKAGTQTNTIFKAHVDTPWIMTQISDTLPVVMLPIVHVFGNDIFVLHGANNRYSFAKITAPSTFTQVTSIFPRNVYQGIGYVVSGTFCYIGGTNDGGSIFYANGFRSNLALTCSTIGLKDNNPANPQGGVSPTGQYVPYVPSHRLGFNSWFTDYKPTVNSSSFATIASAYQNQLPVNLSRGQFIVPVMSASFTSSFFTKQGALPKNLSDISRPAIIANDFVYLFGGRVTSGTVSTTSAWTAPCSDPLTWTEVTGVLPVAMRKARTFVVKNKIIIMDGLVNTIYSASLSNPLVVTATGRSITGSIALFGEPFMAVIKDYLYIYGGTTSDFVTMTGSIHRTSINDIGATWEYMGEMPGERSLVDGYICDDHVYVVGGDSKTGNKNTIFKAHIDTPWVMTQISDVTPLTILPYFHIIGNDIVALRRADVSNRIFVAKLTSPTTFTAYTNITPRSSHYNVAFIVSGTFYCVGGLDNNTGVYHADGFRSNLALTCSTIGLKGDNPANVLGGISPTGQYIPFTKNHRLGYNDWVTDFTGSLTASATVTTQVSVGSSSVDLSRGQFIVPVMSASFTSSFFVKENALPRNLADTSRPAIIANDKIIVYGGLITSGTVSTRSAFIASTSDPLTWTEVINVLPTANSTTMTVMVNNKIILFVGNTNVILSASINDPLTIVDTGRLITASVRWAAVSQPFIAVIKEHIYFYGGENFNGYVTGSIVRTSKNDPGAVWEYMGEMPAERRFTAGYVCDDHVYVVGGISKAGATTNTIFKAHIDTPWVMTQLAETLPSLHYGHNVVTLGNSIYIYGGQGGANEKKVYVASITTPSTFVSSGSVFPQDYYRSFSFIVSGAFYAIGGQIPAGVSYGAFGFRSNLVLTCSTIGLIDQDVGNCLAGVSPSGRYIPFMKSHRLGYPAWTADYTGSLTSASYASILTAASTALAGITSGTHEALQQFVHFLNAPGPGFGNGMFREVVGAPFETRITWWKDATKTSRIFQTEITRSGIFPITQTYKMYNTDGVTLLPLSGTMVDIISYTGAFETARSRSFV